MQHREQLGVLGILADHLAAPARLLGGAVVGARRPLAGRGRRGADGGRQRRGAPQAQAGGADRVPAARGPGPGAAPAARRRAWCRGHCRSDRSRGTGRRGHARRSRRRPDDLGGGSACRWARGTSSRGPAAWRSWWRSARRWARGTSSRAGRCRGGARAPGRADQGAGRVRGAGPRAARRDAGGRVAAPGAGAVGGGGDRADGDPRGGQDRGHGRHRRRLGEGPRRGAPPAEAGDSGELLRRPRPAARRSRPAGPNTRRCSTARACSTPSASRARRTCSRPRSRS